MIQAGQCQFIKKKSASGKRGSLLANEKFTWSCYRFSFLNLWKYLG
jgi:hypothetical protein